MNSKIITIVGTSLGQILAQNPVIDLDRARYYSNFSQKGISLAPVARLAKIRPPRQFNTKAGIKNPRTVNVALKRKKTNTVHHSLKPFGFEATRIGGLLENLMVSTGQRPSVTTSRKGVAAYGIRAGALCGARTTIRPL